MKNSLKHTQNMNKILYLNENKLIFKNGVFGIIYKIILPEKYSLGKRDYSTLNDTWNSALKDLPNGSIFYKQDIFLKKNFDTKLMNDDNFLRQASIAYYSTFESLDHECYLFFLLPNKIINNTRLINPFKKLDVKKFNSIDEKNLEFIEQVESVILSLENIKLQGNNKLEISKTSEKECINYLDLYFNLFDSDKISDTIYKEKSVKVGNKYANLVCLLDQNTFPDNLEKYKKDKNLSNDKTIFFRNYAENFTFDLNFTHIYNQICIMDDNRKQLSELRLRNDKLHKSSSFDKINKFNAEETDKIINDIVVNFDSVRLIRAHNNIIIISDSEKELLENSLKVVNSFKDLDIKPYIPNGKYLTSLYLTSFPFFSVYFTEEQLYISSLEVFCSFINNTGEFKNDKKGVYFNSRISNIPVLVDNWDEEKKYINARNGVVLAGTGGGKSFTINHIIESFINEGISIIIDLGGSYKKLAALYPNQVKYITYEKGKAINVNPFAKSSSEVDSNQIEDLVEFVAIHYKRDEQIKEIEKTSLRKLIEKYYNDSISDYSLSNFILFIKQNENLLEDLNIDSNFFNRKEFLHSMSEFIEDGIYSFLYKKNEEIEKIKNVKIIIFELDQIRDNQLLLTIMLQLVFSTIKEKIWNDKKTKGNIIFDEVAETLKWNGVLGRIEFYYQAIRKQGGSVTMILQDESQLPDNNVSTAIISNMQIMYVLEANNLERLQKRFGLSQHAIYQIASLNSNFTGKNPYSEIFIKRGETHQVYRLAVAKEVWWAYQTEGLKNEKLMEIYQETNDMELAIKTIINLN
jgi:conjugal transfer ATP-binding protein TraC